jgi:transcription antitermination factor NusG
VSCLVAFGNIPAKVDDELIQALRAWELAIQIKPERLFKRGERQRIATHLFADIEAIYQMTDADQRVIVLIERWSKPLKIMAYSYPLIG